MDVIKPFMGIYSLVDRMKSNSKKCPHISSRLDALQRLVEFVQQKEADQLSEDVIKALKKLNIILESAREVLSKFNEECVMEHMMKSSGYKLEFENLNKSLTDAFVTLSGALHVHQEEKLVEQESMLAEQENKLQELEKKLVKQEKKLVEQENMLAEQENKLQELEKKLVKQEKKLVEQENMLAEQENKLQELEKKLVKQERKLVEQENRLAEQEDIVQRVESKMEYQSTGYYCILQ
ncbi:hypothetical protein D5F01_LYC05462 [Larimichthys crocea]|uniref:Mixed lineage kinase domain-containing protein n=1 Tax=Larimichthys crocea TaxID=215358 RepID=A0A6G0IZ30_LARCR|nr:hypothetical protein D5F01_LYC05462 [Larimichthys crocea]